MHDPEKEFIGHRFRNFLIEDEYGITDKPSTLSNPMSNAALERIQHVVGKMIRTFNIYTQNYVEEYYTWTGILTAAVFSILSTTNRQKFYGLGQLIFGRDIILLIKDRVD